ncbi:quinone oxidoreductase-like protein 2 [Tanacetum coccineum]
MSAKSLYFVGGKIVTAIDFVKELGVDNQHIKVINLGINLKDDKSELSILVDRSIGAPHVGDRSMMAKKVLYEVLDGYDLVHAGAEPIAYGSCHVALVHRANLKVGLVGVGAGGGVGLAAVQIGKELEKETKKGSESGCYSQKVVSGNEGGWDSKKLVMIPREGSGIRAPS